MKFKMDDGLVFGKEMDFEVLNSKVRINNQ